MKANRPLSRRSFFAAVGGAGLGAGALALLPGEAAAQQQDTTDFGRGEDHVFQARPPRPARRRTSRTGDPSHPPAPAAHHPVSDHDRGRHADPAGHGRRVRRPHATPR
jgi:hypothetical protein